MNTLKGDTILQYWRLPSGLEWSCDEENLYPAARGGSTIYRTTGNWPWRLATSVCRRQVQLPHPRHVIQRPRSWYTLPRRGSCTRLPHDDVIHDHKQVKSVQSSLQPSVSIACLAGKDQTRLARVGGLWNTMTIMDCFSYVLSLSTVNV